MTLSSGNKQQFAGGDSTTTFAITFDFWDDDDFTVKLSDDTTRVETDWVKGTHYTISGGIGGGTLTVITSPTDYTPATGETLTVKSNVPKTQPTDLPVGGPLPAESVEQQMDQIVRMVQQLSERLDRAPTASLSSTDSNMEFGDLSGETGKYLQVNDDEDGFTFSTVTSAGELTDPVPVANGGTGATTAGAARSSLAVPGLAVANTLTANQTIASTDAGAAVGPTLTLHRDSASPAVSDILGALLFDGEDDGDNQTTYGRIYAKILDETGGTEDGELHFSAVAGASDTDFLIGAQGVYTPSATSGDMGADTINASEYYRDGVLLNLATTDSAATTSGTTVDITGISANINRITIQLDGVSQDAANQELLLQIGDSGGIETTGYISTIREEGVAAATDRTTSGFQLTDAAAYGLATLIYAKIDLIHMGSNIWVASYIGNDNATAITWHGNGQKTLSGELTQIRLTTVAGTATFDLGTMRLVAS